MIFKLLFLLFILFLIKLFILRFNYHDYFNIITSTLLVFFGSFYIISSSVIYIFIVIILSLIIIVYSYISNSVDSSSIIIVDGVINFNNMIKNKYSLSSLFKTLKDNRVSNINNIGCAILKNNELYLYTKTLNQVNLPVSIICSGIVNYSGLKAINKNSKWIYNSINKKKTTIDNIFYAFYYKSSLYIIKK